MQGDMARQPVTRAAQPRGGGCTRARAGGARPRPARLQEVEDRVGGAAHGDVGHERQVLHQPARLALGRLCGAGGSGRRQERGEQASAPRLGRRCRPLPPPLPLATAAARQPARGAGRSPAGQIMPHWLLCSWRGLAILPSRPMGELMRRRWLSVDA